jgi:hypothetical protein
MTPTALAHHTTPKENRKEYRGIMPDRYSNDLGKCETGGTKGESRGNTQHATRNYTGAFGIYRGTARKWAGRPSLASMTYREQVDVADRIAFKGWTNKRGKYIGPVGPFGWGAVSSNCRGLLEQLCRATHPKAHKYRERACRMASERRGS